MFSSIVARAAGASILAIYHDKRLAAIVKINNHSKRTKLEIEHNVLGYEMNCRKKYLLIWGKSKILNINNPQDSILTIIDVPASKVIKSIGFDKNIFDAKFGKGGRIAVIQASGENYIDLMAGEFKSFDSSAGVNFQAESCENFKFKSYRKFKD